MAFQECVLWRSMMVCFLGVALNMVAQGESQTTEETMLVEANTLSLNPGLDLGSTQSPSDVDDEGMFPTSAPDYVLGAIVGHNEKLSLSDKEDITLLVEDGNFSISLLALDDHGSEDVSSFRKAVQKLRSKRPEAVIGQYRWAYAVATEHLRIPYLVTSMTPAYQIETPFLIQLFPSIQVFAHATEDVLLYYNLKKVAIFYDKEMGGVVLERLAQHTWMEVTGFFVDQWTTFRLREELKVVRANNYNTIVAILSPNNTRLLLDQGLSLSMFSNIHKWILLNMGLSEFQLESYVDSRANITVLRLMMDYNAESCMLGPSEMGLEAAGLHDALQLFVRLQAEWDWEPQKRRSNMRKAVKNLQMYGCTGKLDFTKYGIRTENFLQVITLQGYISGKSGTWRSKPAELNNRMEPSRSYSVLSKDEGDVFPDRPLRITIRDGPPWTFKKTDQSLDTGHPLFEGFCIDIVIEMAKLLGFKYNITLVPDGKFGSLKSYGWTGMIRELVDNRADVAVAPFQMSTSRAKVVDFTKPFMTKGTTVMVKRPEHKVWMFHFLSPFTTVVWSAIFVAFCATSLALFAVSRVNSDCHAKYTHNLRESFWYIWGTLLRGSLTGSPHAISSRIISSAWWFFALIISSIYTANLAAFLTITINDVGINTAADLALQDELDYGTVEGSQTETFFNHTRMTLYSRMWAHMSILSPDSMVRRTEHGYERVRKGKYAFIWDSPDIRHAISNSCDLMEVGSPFDLKGYGFAYQKNAPYGERLSWALLTMQDNSILYQLERKWWRPQNCPSQKQSAKTQSLHLDTTAGMYVVILAGVIISFIVILLQILWSRLVKTRKQQTKDSAKEVNGGDPPANPIDRGDGLHFSSRFNSKGVEAENDITYANHSPARYPGLDDWKLKYDSY